MTKKAMFPLIKICSTSITQNRSTNVTQNRSASVTQNWFYRLLKIFFTNVTYDWFCKRYLYLVPQIYSYICAYVCMHVVYAYNVSMLCMYMHCCSNWFHECYSELVSQTLFKISSTNLTQNWFHKCYSKLVSQTLLKTSSTNVTQNWFNKCYSTFVPQLLLERDSQTLLKISSTSVTQN